MSDISIQLVEQVKDAYVSRSPLVIVGGGTKQTVLGRTIDGTLLKVGDHTGIVSYDPKELVLTARAGTPLSELDIVLNESGQMLPFDPPNYGGLATIGGTLACNQSGPARPWAGSIRDMVLGVRLINGLGDHLRFGGQVMKNVAGYDVARLQAGALGSLGVITEISLKVLPRPKASLTLMYQMDEGSAISWMNHVAGISTLLDGAAWINGELFLRFTGSNSAIADSQKILGGERLEAANKFWADTREQRLKFFNTNLPLWRFSVHSDAKPLFLEKASCLDWAGAQRWLTGNYAKEELETLASAAGGHVTLFKGGNRNREVRQSLQPAQRQLQARLKKAFDPSRILNPGRLYSWM